MSNARARIVPSIPSSVVCRSFSALKFHSHLCLQVSRPKTRLLLIISNMIIDLNDLKLYSKQRINWIRVNLLKVTSLRQSLLIAFSLNSLAKHWKYRKAQLNRHNLRTNWRLTFHVKRTCSPPSQHGARQTWTHGRLTFKIKYRYKILSHPKAINLAHFCSSRLEIKCKFHSL